MGRDGHERAAGPARGALLRREERIRLRRRQRGIPVRHVHHRRRRPNLEAGAGREAGLVPRRGLLRRQAARSGRRRVVPARNCQSRTAVTGKSDLDPLAGRTLHGVCTTSTQQRDCPRRSRPATAARCSTSTDGGKSWGFVNLGLAAGGAGGVRLPVLRRVRFARVGRGQAGRLRAAQRRPRQDVGNPEDRTAGAGERHLLPHARDRLDGRRTRLHLRNHRRRQDVEGAASRRSAGRGAVPARVASLNAARCGLDARATAKAISAPRWD